MSDQEEIKRLEKANNRLEAEKADLERRLDNAAAINQKLAKEIAELKKKIKKVEG